MEFRGELLLRRSDAIRQGLTDGDVKRQIAEGRVVVVRRGIYAHAEQYRALDTEARHLLDIRATLLAGSDGTFASHQSAAAVHRIALWRNASKIHIGTGRLSGGHVTSTRHLHAEGVASEDIAELGGIPCTSAARTVADLARSLPFEDAVCAGDSALQRKLTHVAAVHDALRRTSTDRGKPKALQVLNFLDGNCESVGESRSRVYLRHFDIPAPELQVTLMLDDGYTKFRPDCLWEWAGVIGEFDGLSKYTSSAREVVAKEKRRENLLRAHGWTVVRWTWADLMTPGLATILRRELHDRARRPVTTTRC